MAAAPPDPERSAALRLVFVCLAGLSLTVGSVLILLPELTGAYFAWTIRAPIAAATLGGWFFGLGVLAASLARASRWSAARLAVPMVGLGAALLLLATVIHRFAFNWHSPAAWIWLTLCLIMPPGSLGLAVVHRRRGGPPPAPAPPVNPCLRVSLTAAAAAAGACGAVLLVRPSLLLPRWPWPLDPLGARVYAAFLLTYAAGAWLASGAGATQAAAMPLHPFAVLPLLAFATPWLHFDTFHPTASGGVLYLLLTGGFGSLLTWAIRAGSAGQPPAPGNS